MRGGVPERAYTPPLVTRALRLCGILQNLQPMLLGDGVNRNHIGRLAVKMHGYDRTRARRDCYANALGIEIKRLRIWLDWNRHSTSKSNSEPSGDERVRGHDHFVAWADLPGAQRQMQGIKTGA